MKTCKITLHVIAKLIGMVIFERGFNFLTEIFTLTGNEVINRFFAGIIVAVLSTLIIYSLDYLIDTIIYILPSFRKKCFQLAAVEGVWLEVAINSGERIASLAEIKFDKKYKKYRYEGSSYDINGDLKAKWSSDKIYLEESYGTYSFEFIGKGMYHNPMRDLRTVGQLKFDTTDRFDSKNLNRGYGCYYDFNVEDKENCCEIKNEFYMYKLSVEDYIKTIGKGKIECETDEKRFIIEYLNKYNAEKINNK